MNYDFKSMSDFEVMALESQLEMSIQTAILEMRLNDKIESMEEELKEVKEEIKRRELTNG